MSNLSRVEQLLKNILGEDTQEVVPQSRVEVILRAIAGESIRMGKMGFDINDEHYDFDPAEFVCETNLLIGRLPNSSQPKFKGYFLGPISAGNRFNLVPVLTKDGEIGYRDTISGVLYTNQGTGTLEPYE